jgi:hypothetical protein
MLVRRALTIYRVAVAVVGASGGGSCVRVAPHLNSIVIAIDVGGPFCLRYPSGITRIQGYGSSFYTGHLGVEVRLRLSNCLGR